MHKRSARRRGPRTNILDEVRATNRALTVAEFKRLTAPRAPSEHDEQAEVVAWIRETRTTVSDLWLVTAVPHAEQSKAQAGKKWAEGVEAGYPDLLLDSPRGGYHGLRVEMKKLADYGYARGAPREDQRNWHIRLARAGYCVVTCWGSAVAIAVFRWYLALPVTRTVGPRSPRPRTGLDRAQFVSFTA